MMNGPFLLISSNTSCDNSAAGIRSNLHDGCSSGSFTMVVRGQEVYVESACRAAGSGGEGREVRRAWITSSRRGAPAIMRALSRRRIADAVSSSLLLEELGERSSRACSIEASVYNLRHDTGTEVQG